MVVMQLGKVGKVCKDVQLDTFIYLIESSWLQSNEVIGSFSQFNDFSFVHLDRSRLCMSLLAHESTSKLFATLEKSKFVILPSSHKSAFRLGISAKSGN